MPKEAAQDSLARPLLAPGACRACYARKLLPDATEASDASRASQWVVGNVRAIIKRLGEWGSDAN